MLPERVDFFLCCGYKANDDIIYVNFPFKIMRSFRLTFCAFSVLVIFGTLKSFSSLWIFGFFGINSILCVQHFFFAFAIFLGLHFSLAHSFAFQMEIQSNKSNIKCVKICKSTFLLFHIIFFSLSCCSSSLVCDAGAEKSCNFQRMAIVRRCSEQRKKAERLWRLQKSTLKNDANMKKCR